MALKLNSRDLYSIMQSRTLGPNEVHAAYNALDSAVTLRVWENLNTRIAESPHAQVSYQFSRAMQGPAMAMMKRGVAIQAKVRQDETERYLNIRTKAQALLDRLADAVWGPESYIERIKTKELYTPTGKRGQPLQPRFRTVVDEVARTRPRGLNASSDKQCLAFFNTALGFPVEYEIRKTPQGTQRTPSANAKALRKWAERRTKGPGVSPRDRSVPSVRLAAPFVSLILTIREADKMLAVLRTPLDPDGRMRCSYNVAATENWRWSSSKNVYGRGCVLAGTEVLTPNGWQNIETIQPCDTVMQWKDGELEWAQAQPFSTDYDGLLYKVEGEQIHQELTAEHRVVSHSHRGTWTVEAAYKTAQRSQTYIPVAGHSHEGSNSIPRWYAMLMADWSFTGRGWQAAFKKTRKIERFLELAKEYNINFTEQNSARKGYRRFYISGFEHAPLTWGAWVLDADHDNLADLVEEARHWDSHDRDAGFIFFTADEDEARWFATAAHLVGRGATVRGPIHQSVGSYSDTPMWWVNIKRRDFAQVMRKHWTVRRHTGKVYCLTVPSSFFLIRSQGKMSVTGNTNLQNITPSMRRMFCADDGYRFISTDLEQAESYVTAVQVWLITGDDTYWKAILSGDLHTQVCRMAWPELGWLGDFKHDRVIADQDYPGLKYSYRDVAKRIGHGCVTPDHEVLTWSGWVPISSKPSKILCMDYDQEAEWLEVDTWNEFDFDGEMLHFEGTSVDQLVTPNHRMIFSRDPGGTQVLREIRADEWDSKGSVPLGDYYNGTGCDSVSPQEARMIAAIQADAWVSPRGKPEFHFHKERKFERLEKLCHELGVKYSRYSSKTCVDYMMQFPKEAGAYLLDWDYAALKAYSDEHRYWDGHQGKTSISIHSVNRTHLEWIQTINRLIGKGGNIQKPKTSGFGSIVWTLQENNRKWGARASMTRRPISYAGKVYCPTVKTGMFFVRRNGKISVTGNSNYDGSAFGIAQAVGIPFDVVSDFQARYFAAFPAIREYHKWVRGQIREHQYLDTPLLQRRWFFGRPTEDSTFREAIACVPQGTVGSLLNLVMWRCWQRSLLPPSHPDHLPIQLLLQNHDAFLSQTLTSHPLPSIISSMNTEFSRASIPVTRGSDRRLLTIPGEFVTGFNWAYADKGSDKSKWVFKDGNPDGLRKWNGADDRRRVQGAVARPGDWLNRPLLAAYR